MLSFAQDFVARTARLLFAAEEAELWAVTVRGRVVGLLTREAGRSRLSWFDAADPRLTGYAGPADGEPESLAEALSNRMGLPVELSPLPV